MYPSFVDVPVVSHALRKPPASTSLLISAACAPFPPLCPASSTTTRVLVGLAVAGGGVLLVGALDVLGGAPDVLVGPFDDRVSAFGGLAPGAGAPLDWQPASSIEPTIVSKASRCRTATTVSHVGG